MEQLEEGGAEKLDVSPIARQRTLSRWRTNPLPRLASAMIEDCLPVSRNKRTSPRSVTGNRINVDINEINQLVRTKA